MVKNTSVLVLYSSLLRVSCCCKLSMAARLCLALMWVRKGLRACHHLPTFPMQKPGTVAFLLLSNCMSTVLSAGLASQKEMARRPHPLCIGEQRKEVGTAPFERGLEQLCVSYTPLRAPALCSQLCPYKEDVKCYQSRTLHFLR